MIALGRVSSLAFFWRIERRDGAGIGLTSHDRAVTIDGHVFEPAPGITPAAVRFRAGLDPQSSEVEGSLSSEALRAVDFQVGRWDGARVELFAVDWSDPTAPQIAIAGGGLGAVTIKDQEFSAELTGAADRLSAPACPETSPECRADLGDRDCRVDLAGRTTFSSVVELDGNRLVLTAAPGSGHDYGDLCVLDGAASGWRSRILAVDGAALILRDVPVVAIAAGVRVRLTQGCDKRFATCRTRFANALNFRGEPHLPGNDLLTRYPGA